MTLLQAAFIVITVAALSAGQVLFKIASSRIDFSVEKLFETITNPFLVAALVIYFLATIMWLFVLKEVPLRLAYPFSALAFFLVPVLAHFLLGEDFNWNTAAGGMVIGAGVWISVYR